jgi:hypothetical protein
MHEPAGELTRQVGFFQLSDDGAGSAVAAAPTRAQTAAAEAEAVFAAVRNSPQPRAVRMAEPAGADAGMWKEF